MRNHLIIAIVLLLATLSPTTGRASAQPVNLPNPAVVMRGLKSIYVRATSSDDAKRALKSIGQNSSKIEADCVSAVSDRLRDIGLRIESQGPSDSSQSYSEALIVIYTDLMSGTVKVGLDLNEQVILQRSPDTTVVLTTWQKWLNPRSNEAEPIKRASVMLVDQFIDDYLETNPRKAN